MTRRGPARIPIGWFALPVILFLLGVSAIITQAVPRHVDPDAQAVDIVVIVEEPDRYHSVLWLDNGWLIVNKANNGNPLLGELWKMRQDGSQLEMLDIPLTQECPLKDLINPRPLTDGRLGYIVRCRLLDEPGIELYRMAYDFETGVVEQLVDDLPAPESDVFVGEWNPDMTRGIASRGGIYINQQLSYWVSNDGWEELDLGFPQSYGARWSPDGETIAFWAAQYEGSAYRPSPYSLYIMDQFGSHIEILLKGPIWSPVALNWSPDSRILSFTGSVQQSLIRQRTGLWFIDMETRQARSVYEEDSAWTAFSLTSWSPDGTELVGVRFISSNPLSRDTEVIRIDVSDIVNP